MVVTEHMFAYSRTCVRRTNVRRTIVRCQGFARKNNKNVLPVWEYKYMQNTITFHPILEIPNIESCPTQLETQVVSNDSALNRTFSPGQSIWAYRLRRALVGLVLVMLGAFLWTLFAHVTGLNDQQVGADLSPDASREIHVVQSGDTLWSIAMGIDTDGDPRDTVDRLAALNGGSSLYIGQVLFLEN